MKRRDTGILGEKLASDFLKGRGYLIKHKDSSVFIEVRTKKSLKFGSPEESITKAKKERMIATAWHYRQTHDNLPPSWRIDVVAIELDEKEKISRIELIENAISED